MRALGVSMVFSSSSSRDGPNRRATINAATQVNKEKASRVKPRRKLSSAEMAITRRIKASATFISQSGIKEGGYGSRKSAPRSGAEGHDPCFNLPFWIKF